MKYKTTTLTKSVHLEGESPVFGESAIHVSVEDEAAGPFISLTAMEHMESNGVVRMDLEQLEACLAAAKELITEHESN